MDSIIQTFVSTWVKPFQQFQRLKEESANPSIKSSVLFVLIMGLISGLITAIVSKFGPPPTIAGEPIPKAMVWLSIVIVPVVALIGSFLGTSVLWGVITGFMNGSKEQFKSIYRVGAVLSALTPIAAIVVAIPKVGFWILVAIRIWGAVLAIIGMITVLQIKPVRFAIGLAILFGILVAVGTAAGLLIRQQNQQATPDFGELNTLGANAGDDAGIDDEKLNKDLEELANKAKEEANQPAADAKK